MAGLYKGKAAMVRGTSRKDVTAYAFGAHLVEVKVHDRTREVRASRVVSAFAAGTIVNPLTAYSQDMDGAIWGLSSALHEATEIDPRAARYVNDNLADYLIAANADVPDLEVIMVQEADSEVNPLVIKGIGEIGIVGMNAAGGFHRPRASGEVGGSSTLPLFKRRVPVSVQEVRGAKRPAI